MKTNTTLMRRVSDIQSALRKVYFRKALVLLLSILAFSWYSQAQIVTTLSTVNTCPNTDILVSINVQNFTGVAAGSLQFSYDTNVMSPILCNYGGNWTVCYQNLNPAVNGIFLANDDDGIVTVGFFVITGSINIGTGLLVNLRYHVKSQNGYTDLTWNPDPQVNNYSDPNFNLLAATFTGGSVFTSPSISQQPNNLNLVPGGSGSFTLTGVQTNSYQWQVSTNGGINYSDLTETAPYSGVTTNTLTITGATSPMSGYKFRCLLTGNCPAPYNTTYSIPATLLVSIPLPQAFNMTGGGNFCPGSSGIPVGLDGSELGVGYQLKRNGSNIGSPVAGTGNPISFGNQNQVGTYTAEGTNITGTTPMNGQAVLGQFAQSTATMYGSATICAGQQFQISITFQGSKPYTVVYTNGTENFTINNVSPPLNTYTFNVFPTTNTTYSLVSVTDANGCSATLSGSATATVLPAPTAIAGSNSPVCTGDNLELTASGGVSYFWSGPNAYFSLLQNPIIPNVTEVNAGTYTVVVTGANLCTASASTLVVVYPPIPEPAGEITGPVSLCQGTNNVVYSTPVILNATSYAWTVPAGFDIISGQGTTSITVNINNSAVSGNVSVYGTNGCGNGDASNLAVTVNPIPAVSIGSNSPVCEGTTLNLNASGGATYSWTGPNGFTSGQQNPVIPNVTALAAGVYTVTVTSAQNCVNTGNTQVVVLAAPPATAGSNSPICAGSTLTLTSGGGTSYSWSGPNGFLSNLQNPFIFNATVAASGVYTVTVTNAQNCSKTATATVVVNPSPNATAGSNSPVCEGNPLNLTADGGVSYSWTGPNGFTSNIRIPTIPLTTMLNAGLYTVVVTAANQCSAIANTNVAILPKPTVEVSNNGPVCEGMDLELFASGGVSYSWTGPAGFTTNVQNPVITGATTANSGTYNVSVTGANGCVNTGSTLATVYTQPTANAGGDQNIPIGTSTTLQGLASGGSGSFTYSWEPAALVGDPTAAFTATTILTTSTEFTFAITDQLTGCTDQDQVMVNIDYTPVSVNITVDGNTTICEGATAWMTANAQGGTGVYTYEWTSDPPGFTSNLMDPIDIPLQTTTYYVTVSDGFSSATDQVTITVWDFPIANAGDDQTILPGTTAQLNGSATGGSGDYSYFWMQDALVSNPVIPNPVTVALFTQTDLTLRVTDNVSGCIDYDFLTIFVEGQPLGVEAGANPGETCAGEEVELAAYVTGGTGNNTFAWTSDPPGFTSSEQYPVAYPLETTTYYVEVSDGVDLASAFVTVTVNPTPSVFNVSGGGTICAGDSPGALIELDGSETGFFYQLWKMIDPTTPDYPVTESIEGNGGSLSWYWDEAGLYSIFAYYGSEGCDEWMDGVAEIVVNPVPMVYYGFAGNAVCDLNGAVPLYLESSEEVGVTYYLYLDGTPTGMAVSGNGSQLLLDNVTASGTYTCLAVNGFGCESWMDMTVDVVYYPNPLAFAVTGGGSFCAGGNGVPVGLDGSETGVDYYLYRDGQPTGLVLVGNGLPLNFGIQTTAGVYTVEGMNIVPCSVWMTGAAAVVVNPLPVADAGADQSIPYGTSTTLFGNPIEAPEDYTYAWEPSAYLVDAGVQNPQTVALTEPVTFSLVITNIETGCVSDADQVFVDVYGGPLSITAWYEPLNPCAGATIQLGVDITDGSGTYDISWTSDPVGFTSTDQYPFDTPLQTTTYTVVVNDGINTETTSVTVNVSANPLVFNLVGGGAYCAGGNGVEVTLDGSEIGVDYYLYLDGQPTGLMFAGTGLSLSFGLQTAAGSYTVQAMSMGGCTAWMASSATVTVNPLPIANAGPDQSILYGTSTTLAGSPIEAPEDYTYAWEPIAYLVDANVQNPQTLALTAPVNFSLVITNIETGCVSEADYVYVDVYGGPLSISAWADPTNSCAGTTVQLGVDITDGSGVNDITWTSDPAGFSSSEQYPTDAPLQTTTYTVVVNDGINTETASVTVTVTPYPLAFNVGGGGGLCPEEDALITLDGSEDGMLYELYVDGNPTGTSLLGTGSPLSFGPFATAGVYSIIAANNSCMTNMTGSAEIFFYDIPVVITQPADLNLMEGTGGTFSINAGNVTAYQWQMSTDGLTWTNVVDDAIYSGSQTAMLQLTGVTLGMNNTYFQCVLSSEFCGDYVSSTALLNVYPYFSEILTSLPEITACPGQLIIPVHVVNMVDVAAISLAFNYDPSLLTYVGYQNLNPAINDPYLFQANGINGLMLLSHFTLNPSTILNGDLVELIFDYTGGYSALTWNFTNPENNQYSDINANLYAASFTDGSVDAVAAPPVVITQPLDATTMEGGNAYFHAFAGNDVAYQWQVYNGVEWTDLVDDAMYTGANASDLYIVNIPISMDGYLYRCIFTEPACELSTTSEEALLTVTPVITDIITTVGTGYACPGGTVTIPVDLANLEDVAAISLTLGYNPAALVYLGYQNLNPLFNEANVLVNAYPGYWGFSWYDLTPVSLAGGTLLELNFNYLGGYTDLAWDLTTSGNCEYNDFNGDVLPAVYNNGWVDGYTVPAIVGQPAATSVTEGGNALFSVVATDALYYAWMLSTDGGLTYLPLSDNAMYAGTATADLQVNGVDLTMNGYLYACQVSNDNCQIMSAGAALTVIPVIEEIVTTVGTAFACPGAEVVIPVTVTNLEEVAAISLTLGYNPASLVYTGYQNLNPQFDASDVLINAYPGYWGFSWYSLTPVNLLYGTLLDLVFTYTGGYTDLAWDLTTSGNCEYNDFNGDVLPAVYNDGWVDGYMVPNILGQPADISVTDGDNASFSVTATDALTYAWMLSTDGGLTYMPLSDNAMYSGTGTPMLQITGVNIGMNGYLYACQISNENCTIMTDPALLTVNPFIQDILTTAGSGVGCPSDQVIIPVEGQYLYNVAAISLVLNYDPAVAVYTGYQNLNPAFNVNDIIINNVPGSWFFSWYSIIPVNISGGNLIELVFDYSGGYTDLTWDVATPGNCEYNDFNGDILPAQYFNGSIGPNGAFPSITGQPADVTITDLDNASFSVTAVNGFSYQWQGSTDGGMSWAGLSDGGVYSGVNTSELLLTAVPIAMDDYQYRCIVSGDFCSVTSDAAVLNVLPLGGIIETSLPEMVACPGDQVIIPIAAQYVYNIAAISLTMDYDPAVLTYEGYQNENPQLEPGELNIFSIPGEWKLSWFSLIPVNVGIGNLLELVFTYHGGYTDLTWDLSTPGNCEYNDFDGNILPAVYFNGSIGPNGYIPTYSSVPADMTVTHGDNAQFSVTSPDALYYQWQVSPDGGNTWINLMNDIHYSGVTTPDLMITDALYLFNAYQYRCLLTTEICSIPTPYATLTVLPVPFTIITTAQSVSACPGTEIIVPVTVEDLYNVASISLTMNYDPSVIEYVNFQNLHPALSSGLISPTSGQFIFSWYSLLPASVGDGTIVELIFNYFGGTTDMTWDLLTQGYCEYTDFNGDPLAATFVNGTVSSAELLPTILTQPMATGGFAGDPAGFSVVAQDATAYQWQVSADGGVSWTDLTDDGNYSGTQSDMLSIAQMDYLWDGNLYRVIVYGTCGWFVNSDPASLTVVLQPTIVTTAGNAEECSGQLVIPVTAQNFTNVAAMSLTLNFDNNLFDYVGYQNVHPAFDPGLLSINALNGQVLAGYFTINPLFIGDDMLFELVFTSTGGYTGLSWDVVTPGACEYQTIQGYIIPVSFVDGSLLSHPLPVVSLDPVDPMCVDAEAVSLYGSPAGGVYTGAGVMNDMFYPADAGVGTWTLTYTYTDEFGCVNFATTDVTVNPLPVVTMEPVAPVCVDADPIQLVGDPQGGVFSGTGVINDMFYPADAGAGTWTVFYTYTDGNGCVNMTTQDITVYPLPVVTLEPLAPVCVDADPLTLTGDPVGGVYTGAGVMNDMFYPADAGVGTWTITYTYTDGNGCVNFATQDITVNDLPVVTLEPLAPVCVDADPVTLTGDPVGGVYSGTGVMNDMFYPADAGVGTWTITYTYTDGNGCVNFATQDITVNDLPVVTLEPLAPVCVDADPVTLTGNPAGGVYSGAGVMNDMFYPADAGVGTWTITYTYTDGNGCVNFATQDITVNALPLVTLDPLAPVCLNGDPVALNGSPAGGIYSGTGVMNDMFYPADAGVGTWTITYTYTDGNGCTSFATQDITVNDLPTYSYELSATEVCLGEAVTWTNHFTGQAPWTVSFAFNGVPSSFTTSDNPEIYSEVLPETTLYETFTVTDGNGCTNDAVSATLITVYPLTSIETSPVGVAMDEGGNAFFSVVALNATNYQWQISMDGGISWSDLVDDAVYSGVNTADLTITGVDYFMNGDQFRCIVSGICPPPVTSEAATLTVYPVIITIAGDVEQCAGQVIVPVNVIHLYEVAALSLSLDYDDDVLEFAGYQNMNPAFDGGFYLIDAFNSQVKIGYFGITPVDLGDALMVEIIFNTTGGYTDLNWDYLTVGNCEYHNINGVPITSQYINGSVLAHPIPELTQQAEPAVICFGDETTVTYQFTGTGPWTIVYTVQSGNNPPEEFTVAQNDSPWTFTIAPQETTTYTILSITDVYGCTGTGFDPLTITVNELPTHLFTVSDTEVCYGDEVTFVDYYTGTAPWTVEYLDNGVPATWTTYDNPDTWTGPFFETTVYEYLTLTDGNGCSVVLNETITITVNPLPIVSLEPLAPVCIDADPVLLTGTPAGGIYSGTGVTNDMFYPADAGVGTWTITYTYTDENGCVNFATQDITVNPLPVVSLEPLAPVCVDADPVTLVGDPIGGVYSGNGVMNDMFYPAVAGAGTWTITYTYTDGNGCVSFATQDITVNPLPVVTLEPLAPVCVDADPVALVGDPIGGVYSGNGVMNDMFYPAVAGVGTWTITYTYTDGNGCVSFATQDIIVNPLPVVSLEPLAPVCVDADPVALVGDPIGGVYSGNGVMNDMFYPAVAGVGTWTITYTFTDGNGCVSFATQDITVNPLPVVTLEPLAPVCVDADPVTLTGSPVGGVYSGNGVMNDMFYPADAGVGTWTITYTYTDGNGCVSFATQDITVNPLPVVTLEPLAPVCVDAAPVALLGSPVGGVYTGAGVMNDMFYPADAGVGTWTITYTYTDGNGCVSFATQDITVNPLPIVTLEPLAPVCVDADPVTLVGSPVGGVYTGAGVMNDMFYPADAGVGTWTITYTFTDGNGCVNFATQDITVNPLPVVTLEPLAPVCVDADPVTLVGSPVGGVYSGNGVMNDMFYPADAGVGTWTITYTYTDGNGCVNFATQDITVNPLPVVTLEPLAPVCVDADPVTLTGSPVGGVYTGAGVMNDMFYPADAGVGTWTITYTYTDGNGCVNFATQDITVNPLPIVTLEPLAPVCVDADPVTLVGSPVGGVYTGAGVMNDMFYPADAGVGTWTITYTYTDGNGCVNFATQNITVNPLPVVTLEPLAPVCVDADPVTLVGSPVGGVYTGAGVMNDMFYPADAGVGTWTITYTYTDGNGCVNFATQDITVNPLPVVTLEPLAPVCVDADPVTLTGSPVGGVYTGAGVMNDMFYPADAGVGTWTITYTYTDGNGCVSFATQDITVNPLPIVTLEPLAPVCVDADPVTLVGSPVGGVYTGAGVMNDMFYPADAGVGTWTITYTYTDGNGCVNFATQDITVNPLPIVTLEPLAPVCLDADPVMLTGNPSGGTYSGTGVLNNMFYPYNAGVGTWTITYTYTDGNGCTSFATQDITVYPIATVTLDPLPEVCIDADPVVLNGLPAGGVYSGIGVVGNMFYPAQAGAGNWTITYTYTNEFGCTNFATQDILVHALPVVTLDPLADVCVDADPVALSGLPLGGVYSGTGVINNMFYPADAGVGTWTITYTYTDMYGCVNSDSRTITVNVLPEIYTVFGDGAYCAGGNGLPVGLAMSQIGFDYQLYLDGIYTGQTVAGTGSVISFGNQISGGVYTVYAVNPITGCDNWMDGSATIVVNPVPSVFAGGMTVICSGQSTTLNATVVGGTAPFNYTWTPATGLSNPAILNPVATPLNTTFYTLVVTDINGCVDADNALIVVNPTPNVNAGLDKTILLGTSTPMTASVIGGLPPYTYLWTPATGLSNPNVLNPVASPLLTTTYMLQVTDSRGCTGVDYVTITVTNIPLGYDISGLVTYDNIVSTPLSNVTVNLASGAPVGTTVTNLSGQYAFSTLPNGNYTTTASSTKPWGGGNAIDALLISRHFQNLQPLAGLRLLAGDVDGNGVVNANDALIVMRRSVLLITSFPSVPDWIFETKNVTLNNAHVFNNFLGLCYGDVNGSYIPPAKTGPSVALDNAGSLAVNSFSEFDLPVYAAKAMDVAAASLTLTIPTGLEVVDLKLNANPGRSYLVYNIAGNKLMIEWFSDASSVALAAGDALFTMTVRSTATQSDEFFFGIEGESVLGDQDARIIENAHIRIPKVKILETGYTLGNNYPNPFSHTSQISYSLPESADVVLTVYNALGAVAVEVLRATQQEGTYTVDFDGSQLPQGVYMYRLTATGTNGKFEAVRRMVISR